MNDAPGRFTYIAPVLLVTDLKRSVDFYRDQLGFDLDFSYEDSYASVSRDDCHIHLRCADPAPRDQAAFARDELIDACIVVQNAEALSANFKSAGVPFAQPLRQMPYGIEFYIRDPDGYVLGFIQPTSAERNAEQIADAQPERSDK
jgi:catechol 2,3-dioxygenase-like lactoylglutathione lyase family enzyme